MGGGFEDDAAVSPVPSTRSGSRLALRREGQLVAGAVRGDDVHAAARAAGLELSGGGVVRPVPIPADAYTVSAGTFR